jgi:hypothetical protein
MLGTQKRRGAPKRPSHAVRMTGGQPNRESLGIRDSPSSSMPPGFQEAYTRIAVADGKIGVSPHLSCASVLSQRSASMAALHPIPAAVIAWR